jgi:AcrR family transcriptional regulator
MYSEPKQDRSKATEEAFLFALDTLLVQTSFKNLSIDEIAREAGISKGAFLRRFGSKRQALYVLYDRYCEKTVVVMDRIVSELPRKEQATESLFDMSKSLERLIKEDYSCNRAMREDFQENLEVHPSTRRIFLYCVEMMRQTQKRFFGGATDTGAYAAAQILITNTFEYVFNAMPGLPREFEQRHKLMADILFVALQRRDSLGSK